MAYPGGKSSAKHIIEYLNRPEFDGMDYLEPFLGMGHVLYRVTNKRSYTASDLRPNIVQLMNYLQTGAENAEFDHEKFWDTMRKWSANNTVLICESIAPPDFEPVLSVSRRLTYGRSKSANVTMLADTLWRFCGDQHQPTHPR